MTDSDSDTLYADVSEFQVPVNDSYPYPVLCFRSNDGTYRDGAFAANYQWAVNAVNSGKLTFFLVYAYWRSNSVQTAQTLIDMVTAAGGPHPKMAVMIDLESGGNPGGDQSAGVNLMYNMLGSWLGNNTRVIGYANSSDFYSMWRTRPAGLRVVGAGYGANPNLPGQAAHQYTDGNGYGGGLPEGAAPFGNCDMNSADGLSANDFAAACGVSAYTDPPPNAINDKATQSSWLGDRITVGENTCPDGVGKWAQFTNGWIYWHPETGAHTVPASLDAKWSTLNWEAGPLGYPTVDNTAVAGGECGAFQGGVLYHQDGCDVFWVHGAILNSWAATGYEKSPLGWPTSGESSYGDGSLQTFEHGIVYWSPSGIVSINR